MTQTLEKIRKQTKTERLEEHILELRDKMKLDTWTNFVREMNVPQDLFPAMMTGRHQLMPKGRSLTADECQVVYSLLETLLETNSALREHTQQTAILVAEWQNAFKGLETLGLQIKNFANLSKVDDEIEVD